MPGQWTRRLGSSCWSQARALSTARGQNHVKHVTPLRGSELGPTQHDAHRTFRTRKDGTKILPLPPLLDPLVLAARSRHEQTKEKPRHADLTPFQRKLRENPFAQALASPVRECRFTNTYQPSALLTALHVRPHPTTSDPWLLPVSLTTSDARLGQSLRFHTRRLVATQLSKKRAWEKSLHTRMYDSLKPGGQLQKMIWREDMPSLILTLMQDRVVDSLAWSFSFRGRLIPVASPRSEDVDAVEDVGCVLYFGSLRSRSDEAQDRCEAITTELDKWSNYVAQSFGAYCDPHTKPGVTHQAPYWYAPLVPRMQPRLQFPALHYATTTWRGQQVPVYSLTDLLGLDKARDLIEGERSMYKGLKCVVLKRARHSVPVQMRLMQLQTYIARPGP